MNEELIKSVKNDRFAQYIGCRIMKVAPGYAMVRMDLTDNHLNGVGLVQGGATFSLADFTFAAACNAKGVTTLGLGANISYFKPPKGKFLMAEATEVSSSKRICQYNIDVFDENNELIARMSATGYMKG